MYEKPRFLQKYWIWILLIPVVIAIILYGINVWLQWTIIQVMYQEKAGLNWFDITFYHNYTFILAAVLALLVLNPVPWRSEVYDLWETFRWLARAEREPKSVPSFSLRTRRIVWILWQMVKWFVVFSIISSFNGFPFLGRLTPIFYMALNGIGEWGLVSRVFLLPVMPASSSELISLIPTMEVQYRIVCLISTAILVVIAVRTCLKLIKHFIREPQNIWIRDLFIILSCVVMGIILGSPYWTMDATTPFAYIICILLLIGFVTAAFYFQYVGLERNLSFAKRRRMVFMIFTIVIIATLCVNAAIMAGFRLNWNNNWIQYEWKPMTEKQINVTRWAAGIENIEHNSISELPTGNVTRILNQVRQWDQWSAYTRMISQIGYNWMTLADSDILYLHEHEYWAAPTTILYPSTDWISTHLIYTHTSKIIMIDSHTGNYVNVTESFGIPREPLIYYGEGFNNPVYVDVEGFREVENVSYSESPDYILSGWQRALWFFFQGQLGFAFSPPQDSISMLYNRDVLQRVKGILIYGLEVDPDAYLVSDGSHLYYAVQVYINYPIHSGFSASSYLRFFAVVLVDVEDGSMQGYLVGRPDGFLIDFYTRYYSTWKPITDMSAELRSQIRYPEALLGKHDFPGQLDIDFRFHVSDPFVWRSGTEFYERPPHTEVLYVLFTDQNRTYFVGLQLVEYLGSEGKNLAAMYLAFGGEQLGMILLYEVPKTMQLLGPTAAETALKTNEDMKTKLTFYGYYQEPPTARLGNILLYSIGGKLYYFIPLYLVGAVMTTMPEIGIVDATSGSLVSMGSDAAEAYYKLIGIPVEGEGGAEERLNKIYEVFTDAGCQLINVTAVYPEVEIQEGNLTYLSENQWVETESAINDFIQMHVNATRRVLVWFTDDGTVNLGMFVKEEEIAYLYYISIRYR